MQNRMLTRQQAANYCSLTPSGFSDWMRKGLVPGPLPSTSRWDKAAIDARFDALSSLEQAEAPDVFDKWVATYAR